MASNKNSILIIDDQQSNLVSMKALILESFPDSEVLTATSGRLGLKELNEKKVDVIILDIHMPEMDGFDICRLLKADDVFKSIPVIFVTAIKSSKEIRLKALECGGEAFLNKPIDEVELFVQLRAMLNIREKNLSEKTESIRLNSMVAEKTIELNALKEKYRNILDDLPAMICEYLPDGTLTYVNKAYTKNHNRTEKELIGKSFLDLIQESERSKVKKKFMALSPDRTTNRNVYSFERDGELKWQEWRDRAIFGENGKLKHYYSIGIDITRRKKAEEKLVYLSYHDHLTGLYNRRFFDEELKRLDQTRNLPLTIVMADVNGLKLVNDSFGHSAGDVLLQNVAKCMQSGCRADDIIARIGGDEFAIILTNTDEFTAGNIIQRIKKLLRDNDVDSKMLLSVSFGHDTKIEDKEEIHVIFSNAENFMYKRKATESSSMRSQAIDTIMSSLFEKSNREMEHSTRVSEISESIAMMLDFDEERVSEIKLAGLLHDIGKIGIVDSVLNKTERLDKNEWIEIKKHPESGWRILSSVKEYKDIADYIVAHHERWDGKGYPNNLEGEAIPIEARIIAIADAYDAMTSERSYRSPLDIEEAKMELIKNSGTQFDPIIAKKFCDYLSGKHVRDIES